VVNHTHYYGVFGDGHVRGYNPPPLMLDPIKGMKLLFNGASQPPVLNTVIRGASSGAIARVTGRISSSDCMCELMGIFAFRAGETLNFDSGGTATCNAFVDNATVPLLEQFAPQMQDAFLNSLVPTDDGSDSPYWDRNAKAAQAIELSGTTGGFAVGDRCTTNAGGAFTVLLVGISGGNLALKVVRVTGTALANGQTVTNTTQTGGGTTANVGAIPPTGGWVPFALLPNLRGLGTFFEQIPDQGGIGPSMALVRNAYQKWQGQVDPLDRGVRLMVTSSFDYFTQGAFGPIAGGVTVQIVACTGTFPTTWVAGETVTGPGTGAGWSAKVHAFNAAQKLLFVVTPNGETLTGNVTGATSGAVGTNATAAYGWQKGSIHYNNMLAEIATAQAAPSSTYGGGAAKWEGVFLAVWEGELLTHANAGYAAPWPSQFQQIAAWTKLITDLRTSLGRNTPGDELPIAVLNMPITSHSLTVNIAGVPMAYLLRITQLELARTLPRVTLVTTDGMQAASGGEYPYPSSELVFLRPLDYLELGNRAWRALEFASWTIPAGNFRPLPLVLTAGQSQMVNGSNPSWYLLDLDPDLYSTTTFPGVSSADPNVLMWNAQDGVKAWQTYDVYFNGNTFFGMGPGTFSGVVAALALRMRRRFSSDPIATAPVGFIHLGVSASSASASARLASFTWDTAGENRISSVASMTVTALATPQRGRFTASPGTFSSWLANGGSVTRTVQVSGSALGFLGSGGNNTVVNQGNIQCYAVAADGSYVELLGAFVNEGPVTLTLKVGAIGLMQAAEQEISLAFKGLLSQGWIPKPVLMVWWNGESDLETVSAYEEALFRVLDHLRTIFGQRHKGEASLATVILQLTSRTPWQVSDQDIATAIQAQKNVATRLGNAAAVSTDQLPLQVSSPPVYPRTQRQHNGVHHTARGTFMAGYLADKAAGSLVGIPPHPDGDAGAAGDFGVAVAGGGTDSGDELVTFSPDVDASDSTGKGGDSTSTDSGTGTDDASATTDDVLAAIEGSWNDGGVDVAGYTENGQSVQKHSLRDLIELHKYQTALRQRQKGIRRTRVVFSR